MCDDDMLVLLTYITIVKGVNYGCAGAKRGVAYVMPLYDIY